MRTHDLKTWPSMFDDVIHGRKKFEYRSNDRDFALGDKLILKEWDPHYTTYGGGYTGGESTVYVTYIIHGGQFGIPPGFCIMGIEHRRESL